MRLLVIVGFIFIPVSVVFTGIGIQQVLCVPFVEPVASDVTENAFPVVFPLGFGNPVPGLIGSLFSGEDIHPDITVFPEISPRKVERFQIGERPVDESVGGDPRKPRIESEFVMKQSAPYLDRVFPGIERTVGIADFGVGFAAEFIGVDVNAGTEGPRAVGRTAYSTLNLYAAD